MKKMILIDKEKCTGCGACVKDCFNMNLAVEDGKAAVLRDKCFLCGHCVALCPQNAVTITDYPGDVTLEQGHEARISPETLLNAIKMRRSVRQFSDKKVEREKIDKIIEAGRFTPTASNRQNVSYVVVQEKLPQVLGMAVERLKEIGEGFLADENANELMKGYAARWIGMCENYKKNPDEPTMLFFKAKTVILVCSDTPVDGHLAASNMELMVHSLGLGMLFSGFFIRAANGNKELKSSLGIADEKEVVSCLVVGYPDVKYQRPAPRKAAEVNWC